MIRINKADIYMVLIALLTISLISCQSDPVFAQEGEIEIDRDKISLCTMVAGMAGSIQNIRSYDPDYKTFEQKIIEQPQKEGHMNKAYTLAIGGMVYSLDEDLTQEEVSSIIFDKCIYPNTRIKKEIEYIL